MSNKIKIVLSVVLMVICYGGIFGFNLKISQWEYWILTLLTALPAGSMLASVYINR